MNVPRTVRWKFAAGQARTQNEGNTGGSQVGEILLYTNALTDAEQKQNIDYLMAKWGRAEGKRPFIAASVGGASGGEVFVAEGETAYVKSLDTRSGPIVKTGGGTLAAQAVDGVGTIRVKEGQVAFLSGLPQTEFGAGEVAPAPGMNGRFDASTRAGMTLDTDGKGVLRWDSSVTNFCSIEYDHREYLAVTNNSLPTLTGKIPFLAEVDGKQWLDFGEISVTSSKATDTEKSAWMHTTRLGNGNDNSVNHIREVFFVWKPRPAADGTNPILLGGCSDYWRYIRPGKGVMINPVSSYAGQKVNDPNQMAALNCYNAQWAVDGRVVDPTKENFPTDAHVVRVSFANHTYFCGIGNDNFYVRGGFQLGELITYTRELTDRERVDTEAYLMKKWTGKTHHDYACTAPNATSVAYDAVPAALTAGEGQTLQATAFAPTEERPAFLSGETVHIHLDASDASQMDYTTAADGTISVSKVRDPSGNGLSASPAFAHKPKLRQNYLNGLSVLDLGQKGNANSASSDAAELAFSSATGGGCSVIIVYSNQPGSDQYANVIGTYQWWTRNWETGGANSFFSTGALETQAQQAGIYIDGTYKGKGTDAGTQMPAGFHVVAFNNGLGWGNRYAGLASRNAGADDCGGMLLCEVWCFTKTLSLAQITSATDYLMKKWGLGGKSFPAPSIGSVSAAKGGSVKLGVAANVATLSGSGTVVAPALKGVSTIEAKLVADGVEGLAVQGDLFLAEKGTVRLSLAEGVKRVKPGLYPIVTGATLAADTAEKFAGWTLDAPVVRGRSFSLAIVDGQLCLRVYADGLLFIVR